MNELSYGQLVKHRAVIECAPDHCQHRSMTGLGQDNDDLETVPVDTELILVPLSTLNSQSYTEPGHATQSLLSCSLSSSVVLPLGRSGLYMRMLWVTDALQLDGS